MSLLNTAAQQILAARNTCYYMHITDAEMKFVSSTNAINDAEKLIWLNIAQLSAMSSELSCTLTHQQIAERVGKSARSISKPINKLLDKGFLQSTFDVKTRITTYYLDLPNEGLKALVSAPKRGEKRGAEYSHYTLTAAKTYPQHEAEPQELNADLRRDSTQTCDESPRKSATRPYANLRSLILSNNNKTKKHNTQSSATNINQNKNSTTSIPKPMADANALVLKFYAKLESIQQEQPGLSPLQANNLALQAFSREENLELHQAMVAQAKQQEIAIEPEHLAAKTPPAISYPAKETTKLIPIPKSTQVDKLIFEGEHYFIEPRVKHKLFSEIPKLYAENKIKLSGPMRSQSVLLSEILYYITKVNGTGDAGKSQLNKYHIAKKYCQNGFWERPKGLVNQEISKREQTWAAKKGQEIKQSLNTIEILRKAS